ncbi:MAG: type I-E CRISPR-associated protein Cas7/Cse4/CasC [Candidatus Endonucleobacter sp. (ex Gigantidas childressi)]|nr:type I-E CRISPR-associated protein Cas7/Cse4/CasC [Candidatus Endonucleobacter sp. (ex Gigantidas childressi)]
MSRFLQLHILTSYPPANLNRDDLGRPKTAKMGGTDRLRVSSQCLKRNWRTSDLLQSALAGHVGTRTKMLGCTAYDKLLLSGIPEKKAKIYAADIAGQFGKLKKEEKDNAKAGLEIEQLVHVSASEKDSINTLIEALIAEQREPKEEELQLLRKENMSVDIALFGRMLASKPAFNVEAACQVAHAITVHPITIEDDYFIAMDDLNDGSEDAGASHIGEAGFAAGLFYSYICINKELLIDNLNGNKELAFKAIQALTEAAVKVAPTGKQNSFGSRAYASYVLAERGDQQPRSLSVAFLKPVNKQADDYGLEAVTALEQQYKNFNEVYGDCSDAQCCLNAVTGEGKLTELLTFVSE